MVETKCSTSKKGLQEEEVKQSLLTTACLGQKQKEASSQVMEGKLLSVLVVRKGKESKYHFCKWTSLQNCRKCDKTWKTRHIFETSSCNIFCCGVFFWQINWDYLTMWHCLWYYLIIMTNYCEKIRIQNQVQIQTPLLASDMSSGKSHTLNLHSFIE